MRPIWTGNAVGEMHIFGISTAELAKEIGWNPRYLSEVLHGRKTPENAERKVKQALNRLWFKRDRLAHGLSDDLAAVMEFWRKENPEYAEHLSGAFGITD